MSEIPRIRGLLSAGVNKAEHSGSLFSNLIIAEYFIINLFFRPPLPPTYKGHEAILVEINISCSINSWCLFEIIQHTFLFAPFLVNCPIDLLSQSFPQPGSEFISANEFVRKKLADINDKTSQILAIWFFTCTEFHCSNCWKIENPFSNCISLFQNIVLLWYLPVTQISRIPCNFVYNFTGGM